MIDQKDLHIGCSYHIKAMGNCTIETFDNWTQALDFEGYGEPIPLTPEILEACGFVREDKISGSVGSKGFSVFTLYPLTYNTSHGWWIYGVKSDLQFQYLHQIQNVKFALTGEELTYKNTAHL